MEIKINVMTLIVTIHECKPKFDPCGIPDVTINEKWLMRRVIMLD